MPNVIDNPKVRREALIVSFLFLLWYASLAANVLGGARNHDFAMLYTGAWLSSHGHFAEIHDVDAQLGVERQFLPQPVELVPFVRPTFYGALVAPLGFLSVDTAFVVWISLQCVIFAGVLWWGRLHFGWNAFLLGAMYFPTAIGIAHAQDSAIMLLVFVLAYICLESGREFTGGAVLGLGLFKFHLLLLFAPVLLLRKQRRALGGFAATAFVEAMISIVLGGLSAPRKYFDLLMRKDLEHLQPTPEKMINVGAIPANFGLQSAALNICLAIVVVIVVVIGVWKAPLWRWLAITSCGALLIVPHVYGYDAGFLLLSIWLVYSKSERRLVRTAAAFMAAPFLFLLSMLGSPWSVLPAIGNLLFLSVLTWESIATRKGRQHVDAGTAPWQENSRILLT
jgi:hypothetical protein